MSRMRIVAVVSGVLAALAGAGPVLAGDKPADGQGAPEARAKRRRVALFAGGCFWCMQPPFDKVAGVLSTTVGYAGGKEKDPSYAAVAGGRTGHTEAIRVVYDPTRVTYRALLVLFWRNIDPTDANGQFVDRGRQYRPAIFYLDAQQREQALGSRTALKKSKRFAKPIAVEIVKATRFYAAETYHQKFYEKSPGRYYSYRRGSGRDQFLRRAWGKGSSGD